MLVMDRPLSFHFYPIPLQSVRQSSSDSPPKARALSPRGQTDVKRGQRKKKESKGRKEEGRRGKERKVGRKKKRERERKEGKKSGIAKRGRTARGPLLLHMLYHLEIWTKSIFQRICSDKV